MVRRLAIVLLALTAASAAVAGSASARTVSHRSGLAHATRRSAKRCPKKSARGARHRARACKSRQGLRAVAAHAPIKRKHKPQQPGGSGTGTGGSGAGTGGSGTSTGGSGTGTGGSGTSTGGSGTGTGGSGTGTGGSGTGGSGTGTGGSGSTAPWAVQPHTETWAYDDCANGGSSAASALVRSWVTYAEANCGPGGDSKALADCHAGGSVGCDVIQYLDTNWIYPNGSPTWGSFSAAAAQSWYQHTPGSQTNKILSTGYGGGYLINQGSGAVQSFFQNYVRSNYGSEDGLMMDDQSPSLGAQLYYSSCGCSTTDEVSSDAGLQAAHAAMAGAMTRANGQRYLQIDNSLPPNPYQPQGLGMLSQSTNVQGLIAEGEPEYNGTLDPYYSTLLDQIAYVAHQASGFVVPLSYGDAGASYQQQSRRVQEATILLGYAPGRLVDWADLEQGSSDLAVWPEEGIYPTSPVQTMAAPGGSGCLAGTGVVCSSGGHNSLQVAPGVYRREFGACYDHGVSFGPCAAIVNTTGSPVKVSASWLTHSYSHEVGFSGGDVQSGGSINVAGAPFAANATTVAAKDAILLAS
jgi:hypothetical protein